MKPPFISTLAILLLALISPLFAQENGGAHPFSFSQSPYRVGERLTYNVSFSNFPSAAHVEMEVVSRGTHYGRDSIQLRAHVETTGVVNVALYAINTDYLTYVDTETGLPFRSEERPRDAIESVGSVRDFTQPAGNEAIPPKQRGFPGTYDLLSAFYRARALPLASGGVYSLTILGDGEYQAELKVLGKEVIRTNVGSFPTIATQIKVNSSVIKNIRINFSDDPGHIPVLFTARISSGELRAELAGSELIKPPEAKHTPTPPIAVAPAPVPDPPAPPRLDNVPFTLGEQLNYQVFIGSSNTALGMATFQVRGRSHYFDRDGLLLSVVAQTTGAAAQLFVARDQVDSYVDPKALLPYRTVLNLHEGRRRLTETLVVNQEAGTASSDKGTKIDIPVGTHDYLSFFYALRTFNLNPTKKSAISILVENKPKTLFIDAVKRETIQLGDRRIPAIALALTTDDPEADKYKLRMWVSDDSRRLPLRLTCTTKLGPLRADLAILPTASQ
ncbi:MAG TPA: DUF3108 domain-containing protein [Pyrinomonadaceae bacterium]|nr:DUF3108 domain-containing protein [Pyrinomonadaceae bacterium]